MHEHVPGVWKGAHRAALPENGTVCLPAPETAPETGETCAFPGSHPSTAPGSCAHLGTAFQTHTKSWVTEMHTFTFGAGYLGAWIPTNPTASALR